MLLENQVDLPNANFETPNPKISSLGQTLKVRIDSVVRIPSMLSQTYAIISSKRYDQIKDTHTLDCCLTG